LPKRTENNFRLNSNAVANLLMAVESANRIHNYPTISSSSTVLVERLKKNNLFHRKIMIIITARESMAKEKLSLYDEVKHVCHLSSSAWVMDFAIFFLAVSFRLALFPALLFALRHF
jgi:hypothetical protein